MNSASAVLNDLAAGKGVGLVMDFDGVLSPITEDPDASELLPGTAGILARLATRLPVVALLSGRPVGFLVDRATVPGVQLHGSYGLEHLTDGRIEVLAEARQWEDSVRRATEVLHRELDAVDGVYVEDKTLAVAVHWRRAADRDQAWSTIAPLVQRMVEEHGLRREPGKFVEELRMPLDQDKGTALRRILTSHGLTTVAYAGDDLGDLPAFQAAITAGGYALVVDGADTAPEISRVHGVHFDGPAAFQAWLQQLDDALREGEPPAGGSAEGSAEDIASGAAEADAR